MTLAAWRCSKQQQMNSNGSLEDARTLLNAPDLINIKQCHQRLSATLEDPRAGLRDTVEWLNNEEKVARLCVHVCACIHTFVLF